MVPYLMCQQQSCWSRPHKFAIALSVGILLGSCEPNEMYPVPVGGLPGEANPPSQNYRPSQSGKSPTQPLSPMLENPDAETVQTSEEVWANSEGEAMEKCQKIAESRTREGRTLVTVQGIPQKVFKGRYVCTFRGETK